MKLIVASNNQGKINEIKSILSTVFNEILSLKDIGCTHEVIEDGDTFESNAVKKAEEILNVLGAECVLADDSGLMVDFLSGAPGVLSARFSGEGATDEANNQKLLALLKDVQESGRAAKFVSCVALARKGMPTVTAFGECAGTILSAPIGDGGFGYDPIFYYPPLKKSYAQLTLDEKNGISHRRRALNALLKQLV